MGFQQDAFMASNNYIRKVLLPIHDGSNYTESKKTISFTTQLKETKITGLTGVEVSFSEDVVKNDCIKRNKDSCISWLKIKIPESEFLMFLDRPLSDQPQAVQLGLFEQKNLGFVFITEAQETMKEIYASVENLDESENKKAVINNEIHGFYENKRKYLLNFKTATEFVNFLNKSSVDEDSDKTTSFLYECGIKGVVYSDNDDEKILLFNAKDDIEVTDIFRTIKA